MKLGIRGQNNTTLYGGIRAYRFTKKGKEVYPTAEIKNDKDAQKIIASDDRVFIVDEGFEKMPSEVKHSKYIKKPKETVSE